MKTAACCVRLSASVVLLVAAFCGTVRAATLTVGSGKTYATIQAAVTAAGVGDTINVDAGTYNENITIATNNLTLKSIDGDGLAIINGNGTNPVVSVGTGLGVVIDGFTIDGNTQTGITHGGGAPTDPVTIVNNTILDCDDGFYSWWTYMEGAFTFSGNTVSDCTGGGMAVYGFDGAIIVVSANTFTDCYTGISLQEVSEGVESDVTVSDNTITATAGFTGDSGIYNCCPETTTTFIGNTVTGDYAYGMYVEDIGCCGLVPGIVYIIDNTLTTDNGYGLYIEELSYGDVVEVTITGNILAGNDIGLYVFSHDYPSGSTIDISNNDICGNTTWGFLNDSGENVPVDGNWWGDPSGPSGDGTGTGDAVSTGFVPTTFLAASITTPAPAGDDGGCTVGALGLSGMSGTLAILALALISMRRKVRREIG